MGFTQEQQEAFERACRARKSIPKAFRQYAKRYAKKSPEDVLSQHAKYNVPMLNHGRERAAKIRRLLGTAKVPA